MILFRKQGSGGQLTARRRLWMGTIRLAGYEEGKEEQGTERGRGKGDRGGAGGMR